jgi:hypothetical protein
LAIDSAAIFRVFRACLLAYFLPAILFSLIFTLVSSNPLPKIDSSNPAFGTFAVGVLILLSLRGLWIYAPSFIVESVAIREQYFRPFQVIQRCRHLTKPTRRSLLGVILTVFLITFPASFMMAYLTPWIYTPLIRWLPIARSAKFLIHYVLLSLVLLLTLTFTMPLWQTTKAVYYYNLLCQQEGKDLQLRDR